MARLLMITVTVVFKTPLPRMNVIGIISNQFIRFHAVPMAFVLIFSPNYNFLSDDDNLR